MKYICPSNIILVDTSKGEVVGELPAGAEVFCDLSPALKKPAAEPGASDTDAGASTPVSSYAGEFGIIGQEQAPSSPEDEYLVFNKKTGDMQMIIPGDSDIVVTSAAQRHAHFQSKRYKIGRSPYVGAEYDDLAASVDKQARIERENISKLQAASVNYKPVETQNGFVNLICDPGVAFGSDLMTARSIAFLFYMASLLGFDGKIVQSKEVRNLKTIDGIAQLLGTSWDSARHFLEVAADLRYITLTDDNEYTVNPKYFVRGKVNRRELQKQGKQIVHIMTGSVTRFYCDKHTNATMLGHILALTPLADPDTGILCHNPGAADKSTLKPLSLHAIKTAFTGRKNNSFADAIFTSERRKYKGLIKYQNAEQYGGPAGTVYCIAPRLIGCRPLEEGKYA